MSPTLPPKSLSPSLSDEDKNNITFATSLGMPILPNDMFDINSSLAESDKCADMSVSINPGATVLTVIPNLPSSFAADVVSPIIADFVSE